jgi:hypothetical protein
MSGGCKETVCVIYKIGKVYPLEYNKIPTGTSQVVTAAGCYVDNHGSKELET